MERNFELAVFAYRNMSPLHQLWLVGARPLLLLFFASLFLPGACLVLSVPAATAVPAATVLPRVR